MGKTRANVNWLLHFFYILTKIETGFQMSNNSETLSIFWCPGRESNSYRWNTRGISSNNQWLNHRLCRWTPRVWQLRENWEVSLFWTAQSSRIETKISIWLISRSWPVFRGWGCFWPDLCRSRFFLFMSGWFSVQGQLMSKKSSFCEFISRLSLCRDCSFALLVRG